MPSHCGTSSARKGAGKLGQVVGCENMDSVGLVECLRHKSTEELLEALIAHPGEFPGYPLPFITTIDSDFVKTSP